MAGDIPQFHRGRFGKVSSQDMNAMGDAARKGRNDLETSPTPFAREAVAAPGSWPILAQITGIVTENKTIKGYKWQEVVFFGGQFGIGQGRGYIEDESNYCIPFGLTADEYSTVELIDAYVRIFYTGSEEGTVLYFELPPSTPKSTVEVLEITGVHEAEETGGNPLTPNCRGFGPNGQYLCKIVRTDPDFFKSDGVEKTRPSFSDDNNDGFTNIYAYNLLEYGDGKLGGEQEVDDCNVEEELATIPVGTLVVGKLIAQWQDNEKEEGRGDEEDTEPTFSRAYAFSVVTDTCVRCCIESEEGLYRSTFERSALHKERKVHARSPTSIVDEMIR